MDLDKDPWVPAAGIIPVALDINPANIALNGTDEDGGHLGTMAMPSILPLPEALWPERYPERYPEQHPKRHPTLLPAMNVPISTRPLQCTCALQDSMRLIKARTMARDIIAILDQLTEALRKTRQDLAKLIY